MKRIERVGNVVVIVEGSPEEILEYDRLKSEEKRKETERTAEPKPEIAPTLLPRPWIPGEIWTNPPQWGGGACLFDGLPDGAYLLSCPCPLHSPTC